jgi:mono/diheme cytochrome c family protein
LSTLKEKLMRLTKLIVLFVIFTLALSIALPAFAADGAATYKAKCAACHGPEGQGKVGPAVKGTSLSADQIADLLTKGEDAKKAPHKKAVAGVSADDAKAVADFIKTLK